MITCTRRIQFCAGHRVMGHENKCGHLHGHNYVALFTAQATGNLDDVGRVVDFSVLKQKLGAWIDAHWDHGFIYNAEDEETSEILKHFKASDGSPQKVFAMFGNPTAENMADYLLREVAPKLLLGTGCRVTEVKLWETENCYAVAAL